MNKVLLKDTSTGFDTLLAEVSRIRSDENSFDKDVFKYRIAFTNGVFDIYHAGHARLIKWIYDTLNKDSPEDEIFYLIVALNDDESARRQKGEGRPINKLADRAEVLSSVEGVDFVTSFNEDSPLELIKLVKPDVLVKGGDYKDTKIVGQDFVESYGGKVLFGPYDGISTTKIAKGL